MTLDAHGDVLDKIFAALVSASINSVFALRVRDCSGTENYQRKP
jgi:hypothetical protein